MITMTATEFKAKCLNLLDQVNVSHEEIEITKHGKVVARLVPSGDEAGASSALGCLKGKIQILGDIISPIDIEWDALK